MNAIEKLIRDLNSAWLDGRTDDLHAYFDKDVILLAPGSEEEIVGVERMVQSYRDFLDAGTIHAFQVTDLKQWEFAGIAVAHVDFRVDYEIPAGRFQERGREVYVIATHDSPPRIVWRTQIAAANR